MTIEITEPKTPEQAEAIRRVLHRRWYRKGTFREIFVDVPDRDEPRLLIVNLNLIPGVRAKVFGEFDSSPVQPIHP